MLASSPTRFVVLAALLSGALSSGLTVKAALGQEPPSAGTPVSPAETAGAAVTELEATWGVRFESVRVSGAGALIDIRYRVLDAEKAAKLLGREQVVYLEDEATGLRYAVPKASKLGSLRQTARKAEVGKVYFILFGNPARQLVPGSRVALVMGDLRWPHLVVR